tara:strand:+ start:2750 stop:2959 length:210 start_codon:yes stop_codon:yes gene_type:complete
MQGNVYKIRKPLDDNMSLGESIEQLKQLSKGIDEYHIINPTSSVIFKLTDMVNIIKNIEIPELIGESTD